MRVRRMNFSGGFSAVLAVHSGGDVVGGLAAQKQLTLL
jgi:hypothetical protein